MIVAIKIITNKWTYISLIFIGLIITISVLTIKIKRKDKKIEKLNDKIVELEVYNKVLSKDIEFNSNKMYLMTNGFNNSAGAISNINSYELNSDDIEAIKSIINDYNKNWIR